MPTSVRGAGVVRIVSGKWRRSVIPVQAAVGLRPTSERVRETVFDWLGHLLPSLGECAVLDLFAGSGAMGFEAASRGADQVDWVDVNRQSIAGIRAALQRLGADSHKQAHVMDAFRHLQQTKTTYDLIFIDPPFDLDLQRRAVEAAKRCMKPEGLLYVESPKDLLADEYLTEQALVRVRSGSAGSVRYELLAFVGSAMAGLARPSKEEKRRKK